MTSPVRIPCLVLALSLVPAAARAGTPDTADEPGLAGLSQRAEGTGVGSFWFETALAFGYSSLLADPDVDHGYGGGLDFTFGFHPRLGVHVSVYFTTNPYTEQLGAIGSSFLAGNITLGPVVRLLPPQWRTQLNLMGGLGAYIVYVAPGLWQEDWNFGINFGAALSVKIVSWLGVGVRLRYHIFNLAGGQMKDVKSFTEVGVLDRLELPVFVAFYF
jgi:hypothetical protein